MAPKRILITVLKFGVSLALLAYLVYAAIQSDEKTFSMLLRQPKQWDQFAIAFLLTFFAVLLTIVRWFLLVRALELPFQLRDGLRLGFLGYFCNFFSLGSVGGDLFKAIFIAREHPGRRPEAVATVFVDRVIGLYALFVVASIAIVLSGLTQSTDRNVQIIRWVSFGATAVGALGITALLIPGMTAGRFTSRLARIPKVGHIVEKLIGAIRMYRSRLHLVGIAGLMSLVTHCMFAIGIYFMARGLPADPPSLASHFVVVPLALLTGALPLPLSGLGAFEVAIEYLYRNLPIVTVFIAAGYGLVVALVYRLMTIGVAMVGAVFYFHSRREVADAMEEIEHEMEEGEGAAGSDGRGRRIGRIGERNGRRGPRIGPRGRRTKRMGGRSGRRGPRIGGGDRGDQSRTVTG